MLGWRTLQIAGSVLLAASCGSTTCTAVGCVGGVDVVVEASPPSPSGAAPDAVRLCVGERCASAPLRPAPGAASVRVDAELERGTAVAVTLTFLSGAVPVAERSGRLPVRDVNPNGTGCPPACASASGSYRGGQEVEPLR